MKISEITFSGYQSIGHEPVTIKTDGITILTGPNSSGKSAVLDFINGLKKNGLKQIMPFARLQKTTNSERGVTFHIDTDFFLPDLKNVIGFESQFHTVENDPNYQYWDYQWNAFEAEKFADINFDLFSFIECIRGKNIRISWNTKRISIYLDDDLVLAIDQCDSFSFVRMLTHSLLGVNENEELEPWIEDLVKDTDDYFDEDWVTINPKICGDLGMQRLCGFNILNSEGSEVIRTISNKEAFGKSAITRACYKEEGSTISIYGMHYQGFSKMPLEFDAPWFDDFELFGHDAGSVVEILSSPHVMKDIFDETHELRKIFTNTSIDARIRREFSLEILKRTRARKKAHRRFAGMASNLSAQLTCFIRLLNALLISTVEKDFSQISGNRTILDSSKPVAIYSTDREYPQCDFTVNQFFTDAPYGIDIKRFASAIELSKNSTSLLKTPRDPIAVVAGFFMREPELSIEVVDFVSKYFPSLDDYEFVTETKVLAKIEANKRSIKKENAEVLLIFLRIKNRDGKVLDLQDVGSGISYVLPVITGILNTRLTFIEEPELHLHPSAQCDLGDVFIAAVNKGRSLILETHSEHLILRVLRRIRDTTTLHKGKKVPAQTGLKLLSKQVNLYYFKPDKDGKTTVKHIRVDEEGGFLNTWPDGFFGERENELFS